MLNNKHQHIFKCPITHLSSNKINKKYLKYLNANYDKIQFLNNKEYLFDNIPENIPNCIQTFIYSLLPTAPVPPAYDPAEYYFVGALIALSCAMFSAANNIVIALVTRVHYP